MLGGDYTSQFAVDIPSILLFSCLVYNVDDGSHGHLIHCSFTKPILSNYFNLFP